MKHRKESKVERIVFAVGVCVITVLIVASTFLIHLVFNSRVESFELGQVFAEENLWDTTKGLVVSALLVGIVYLVRGRTPEWRVSSLRLSYQLLIFGVVLLMLGGGIFVSGSFYGLSFGEKNWLVAAPVLVVGILLIGIAIWRRLVGQ
ncbi:hypothetical protein [Arhodomonas sp. AD133]|uniref:hypothetical protein n=1 Tax=Arhodomonas sp. AD133 TaxID=3415009 RepID=UPI003EBF8F85